MSRWQHVVVATVVPVAGVAVVLLGLPAIHAATAAGVVAVHALPAGRYGIVCYLPVNGDDANGPHYKKGMKAELTVQ
ncbi:MAG: hypothetical protein QOD57_365 [Actinomycetota bacterium]|jgi:hypothetical protein|nr:hypothetical protein [Actinomycetota bacterium]